MFLLSGGAGVSAVAIVFLAAGQLTDPGTACGWTA